MMLVWKRMIQLIQVCLLSYAPEYSQSESRSPCILNCSEYKGNILRKKIYDDLVASTHVPAVKQAKFLILEKLPDATGEHYRKADFQSRAPQVVTAKEARFTC